MVSYGKIKFFHRVGRWRDSVAPDSNKVSAGAQRLVRGYRDMKEATNHIWKEDWKEEKVLHLYEYWNVTVHYYFESIINSRASDSSEVRIYGLHLDWDWRKLQKITSFKTWNLWNLWGGWSFSPGGVSPKSLGNQWPCHSPNGHGRWVVLSAVKMIQGAMYIGMQGLCETNGVYIARNIQLKHVFEYNVFETYNFCPKYQEDPLIEKY